MQDKYPKILLLAGWYPNSLNLAEGDFIKYQAQQMAKEGLNVSVFHSSLSYRYLLKGRLGKRVFDTNKDGLHEHLVERPFFPRNSRQFMKIWAEYVLSDMKRYLEKHNLPDIIHAHTYLGGYMAQIVKKRFGSPYLLTLHETTFLTDTIPSHHEEIVKDALAEADEVIAVSKALAQKVEEKYSHNPIVVPNFINFELFKPSSEKNEKFTFIYVGDLIERKNVELLIDSFSKVNRFIPDSELVIIGDGPYIGVLKKLCKVKGINTRVRFKERLGQKKVARELGRSHCFVLPSRAETFGIVLVEALASGIPVISTTSGGSSDIVNEKNGILLSAFSSDEMSSAMLSIYDTLDKYPAHTLRQIAESRFSGRIISKVYSRVYENILQNSANE